MNLFIIHSYFPEYFSDLFERAECSRKVPILPGRGIFLGVLNQKKSSYMIVNIFIRDDELS